MSGQVPGAGMAEVRVRVRVNQLPLVNGEGSIIVFTFYVLML